MSKFKWVSAFPRTRDYPFHFYSLVWILTQILIASDSDLLILTPGEGRAPRRPIRYLCNASPLNPVLARI